MTDTELDSLVDYRQSCAAVRDAMQDEIDQIGGLLKEELGTRGTRRVERAAWVIQMVHQDRQTLNKKKLLSAGVTTTQIEAATEITPVEVLRVEPRTQKEGG
jgi:hypothetical protein